MGSAVADRGGIGQAPDVLVLQHIACEPPGAFEDELRDWDLGLMRVEVDAGEPIPDWRGFAAVIAMGGPMGAYEEADYPWLAREKRVIGEAARSGAPIWGVCLGAQLLACALGADVRPGGEPEVGVLAVRATAEATGDPVFSALPEEFPALQWHGDTFDLPAGAVRLAGSQAYEEQAFRFRRAYGLQFHLEVTTGLAVQWGEVPAYARSLEKIMGAGALPRMIAEIQRREPEMTGLARTLFARWLEHVVGARRPAPATSGGCPSTDVGPASVR
jgi:GMP synthase (glutamine-hydrolysing)